MVQQNINMRDYNITKYKGNTHYQVYVTDSYGREKGNFFGMSKDISFGDLINPFRGFELGKEGNIFQRILNSSTK